MDAINLLPPELLADIFALLDQGAPSLKNLYSPPFHNATQSKTQDLKSVSCVSRRWRRVVLPTLCRNARMLLQSEAIESDWPTKLQDFSKFVRQSCPEARIHSFTLVVRDEHAEEHGHNPAALSTHLDGAGQQWRLILDLVDPLRITIVAPPPRLAGLVELDIKNTDDSEAFHMPYHLLSLSRRTRWIRNEQSDSLDGEDLAYCSSALGMQCC